MPTECLFRDDSYLKSCDARVVAVTEQGGIVLDRTVFYATSGGQPGDTGTLTTADGTRIPVELILRKIGAGMSPELILADHPRMTFGRRPVAGQ